MTKNILKMLSLLLLFILIGAAIYSYDIDFKIQEWQKQMLQLAKEDPPFEKGERLIFKVNFKGINIGNAQLIFQPNAELDNLKVNFVKFNANLTNLYDLEEIYADKLNYRPLKVKRTINIFGQPMNITEEYDQKQNFVKIIKNKNGTSNEQKLHSDGPLDNIILIIYEFRKMKRLNLGDTFDFNLPTRKIKMMVKAIERISVPLGTYNAYRIESSPSKFKIWLNTDINRLPLRLEGVAFLGLAVINLSGVKSELEVDTKKSR